MSWSLWKAGRSAWIAWSRLERLHKIVEQEKWEIENHRSQEREELKALYQAKGFQGKLLDDVVDVLMADGDRLLRVMLEEELGFRLHTHDHPLKQALGAFSGSFTAASICLLGAWAFSTLGIIFAVMLSVSLAAFIYASYEKSKKISAIVWNIGIAAITLATGHFLLNFFKLEV